MLCAQLMRGNPEGVNVGWGVAPINGTREHKIRKSSSRYSHAATGMAQEITS